MSILAVSDTHGYFRETVTALNERGLADGKSTVLLNGDALDRGGDAVKLADFLIELQREGRLIYVRGNHEDLMERAIAEIERGGIWNVATCSPHAVNGTFDTLLQLADMTIRDAIVYPDVLVARVKESPFYSVLLPTALDYYETNNYVFTHGWIPCNSEGFGSDKKYLYDPNWRTATAEQWRSARWSNGMQMAVEHKITVPNKTVVCGHYHTSYGHARYEKICTEFGEDADLTPFYSEGIIAIDGCVAHSGTVNCIVIDD